MLMFSSASVCAQHVYQVQSCCELALCCTGLPDVSLSMADDSVARKAAVLKLTKPIVSSATQFTHDASRGLLTNLAENRHQRLAVAVKGTILPLPFPPNPQGCHQIPLAL